MLVCTQLLKVNMFKTWQWNKSFDRHRILSPLRSPPLSPLQDEWDHSSNGSTGSRPSSGSRPGSGSRSGSRGRNNQFTCPAKVKIHLRACVSLSAFSYVSYCHNIYVCLSPLALVDQVALLFMMFKKI